MDTTLVGVTLLSMAMAIALSIVVWRLLRDERRRSEARVAALADMMTRGSLVPRPSSHVPGPASRVPRPVSQSPDLPLRREEADPQESDEGRRTTDPRLATWDLGRGTWDSSPSPTPWKNRAVVMAALGLVAAAVLLTALTLRDRGRAQQTPGAAVDARSPAAAVPQLELLSLRDSRDASTLTITGVVQNSRNGAMLRRVTVTAFAFDRDGGFLASGQALIDITALAPGDESPFVVAVPVAGTVARYRIGFRGEDGRVIAHVDKRQRGAVARAERSKSGGWS